jgi:putative ABC transport system ATP-binding protein
MNEFALETRDVNKVYGSGSLATTAVKDVSLKIKSGEFVALVGPSGSGKTTMLSMLAALLRPTAGQILIDGQDLAKLSDARRTQFRRENIGFTFQANNLLPFLNARENVELMLRLNGTYDKAGARRVEELMERLGLQDRMKNLPRQLSGGQQQRVAIARALVHNPAVVLADEPTAALDTERAHQVVQTFANLIHEQNRAGVMVTHDLRMVQYADRVVQMMDGRVVREITGRAELDALASEGKRAAVETPKNVSVPPKVQVHEPILHPAVVPAI